MKKIDKRILLGVSGGIAAYKSAQLARLLRRQGADVRVVMTLSATRFVTPLTFQALTGHAVHSAVLDEDQENAMGHINLVRWADVLLVAPATANVLAKFSLGIADDLLSTLYLASECPVFVAPAMNQAMWAKPVTRENLQRLRNHGVTILGPDQGEQACGETGPGRMLEPVAICHRLFPPDCSAPLHGKRVLISAGPTREPLDPVRYISNRSSGKMGYALAAAAVKSGASVTLVSGPVALTAPAGVDMVMVETAQQMYDAVITRASQHDIYIGAAAVADYTPAAVKDEKIKKHNDELLLPLQKTRDILAAVAALPDKPFSVGFAAETEALADNAKKKLHSKNLDMIAANWVGRETGGFDSDQNALRVFWKDGQCQLEMADKKVIAGQLLGLIAEKIDAKSTT